MVKQIQTAENTASSDRRSHLIGEHMLACRKKMDAEPCPDMALIPLCWVDMATTERLTARQASELKERAGQWLRLAALS